MPDNIVPGRVYAFEPGQQPPTSSLANAFFAKDGLLADAVVLRGYLGRSPILKRARQYLEGAMDAVETAKKEQAKADAVEEKAREASEEARELADERARVAAAARAAVPAEDGEAREEALARANAAVREAAAAESTAAARAAALERARTAAQDVRAARAGLARPDDAPYDGPEEDRTDRVRVNPADAAAQLASIEVLIDALDEVTPLAQPHVPWRIYLTPALNRYVDFHLFSLLAWRQEPKTERKDTFTVWLRAFTSSGQPLPYRVIEETQVGPSFSTYLGGDLVDDFLGDSGASGGAWGQPYGGGRPGSGTTCGGRWPSGTKCGG